MIVFTAWVMITLGQAGVQYSPVVADEASCKMMVADVLSMNAGTKVRCSEIKVYVK